MRIRYELPTPTIIIIVDHTLGEVRNNCEHQSLVHLVSDVAIVSLNFVCTSYPYELHLQSVIRVTTF